MIVVAVHRVSVDVGPICADSVGTVVATAVGGNRERITAFERLCYLEGSF